MTTAKLRPTVARRARAGALLAALALPAAAPAYGAVTVPSDAKATLPKATLMGRTAADRQISLAVMLPSRDAAGAAAFVAHVTKPRDPLFRHYLTPAQFAAQFGASAADYQTLKTWATAHGLTAGEEFTAHTVLPLHGPVAAVEAAFGVHFKDYKDSTGRIFYNADASPTLPDVIGKRMSAVLGLSSVHQFAPLVRKAPPNVKTAALKPGAGGTGPGGTYSAADLRTAYSVPTQSPGTRSETVAVFEQGGFDPNDIATYLTTNKLPNVPVKCRSVNGYGCTINDAGVELEAVLDIDMVIGINPLVRDVLVYEDGNDPFGVAIIDSFAAMANDDKAQTISVSYGIDEAQQDPATIQSENTALQQLVAQGQGVFVSAGDDGAYGREGDGLNAPDPGSQPLVVSVGGTTLYTGGQEQYFAEEVWNNLAAGAGATGGGVSSVWPIPDYQVVNGTSVAVANGGSATFRNVPDISAVANPLTGVGVYSALNGGWIQIGGTSVSAPIWAGYTSIANAASKQIGFGPIGFANPSIYAVANGASLFFFDFFDTADGSNGNTALFGIPGFNAGFGYDNTTGYGSPVGNNLAVDLAVVPASGNSNPPPPPIGLTEKATPTSVVVGWTPETGVKGYVIVGFNLNTGASANSVFTKKTRGAVTGLVPATPYLFQVVSLTTGGEGISAPVYVTTPAN